MTPLPSGGFVGGLPEEDLVNRDLPVPYEAVWRDGGDGSALQAFVLLPHEEDITGDAEVDALFAVDQTGARHHRVLLRRHEAYGVALLDSMQAEDGRSEQLGPRGFFFGRSGGNDILKFGEVYQDDGSDVAARALTRQMAPMRPNGECLFRDFIVVLEYGSGAEVTVTPILDGDFLDGEAVTFIVGDADQERTRHEVALTRPKDSGGAESSRQGLRGTWIAALVEVKDVLGTGNQVSVEGVSVRWEPARESKPAVDYAPEPLDPVDLTNATRFFFGLQGRNDIGLYGSGRDDLGDAIEVLARPNPVAPAGADGECLFARLYLAITRNNPTDLDLEVTPIVDDVAYEGETITLAGVSGPTTAVHEIGLSRPLSVDGAERSRAGLRGTWFEYEAKTVGAIPDGDVVLEAAGLEFEALRESEGAEGA